MLWRGGEQVLANVLQIAEMARQYEADGGLSFRGFVDELRTAPTARPRRKRRSSKKARDGVRLMTVHKAKGLEFPVVILADIGCKLSRDDASRYLDTKRGLCAIKLGGWTPIDLAEHNDLEAAAIAPKACGSHTSLRRGPRICWSFQMSATRPTRRAGCDPLAACIYPPLKDRQSPGAAAGTPAFKGKDTVLERPDMATATASHGAAWRLRDARPDDRRALQRGVVGPAGDRRSRRRAARACGASI